MDVDDHTLLRQWCSGDRDAGEVLVRRHLEALYRFVASRVGDAAEDAVQRAFETCLENADRFRGDGSFRAYLFRVAHNQLINDRRDWHHDAVARADAEHGSLPDDSTTPTEAVRRKESAKVLLRALSVLPDDLRHAVELFYWGGLSTPEIADVLGIPKSTVTSRLQRARELLRDRLSTMDINAAVRASTLRRIEGE